MHRQLKFMRVRVAAEAKTALVVAAETKAALMVRANSKSCCISERKVTSGPRHQKILHCGKCSVISTSFELIAFAEISGGSRSPTQDKYFNFDMEVCQALQRTKWQCSEYKVLANIPRCS